jgi:hypothetical protein
MELRKRFPHCDQRLLPYVEEALKRIPPEWAQTIIANPAFHILAAEDLQQACSMRLGFAPPVENLVVLNTLLLKESDDRIVLTIAAEMARHVAGLRQGGGVDASVEALLHEWGFSPEIESVRWDQSIARTPGYQRGYTWARHQSKDYLLQHFGLLREQWQKQARASGRSEPGRRRPVPAEMASILDALMPLAQQSAAAGAAPDPVSPTQALIAGIMAAMKAIELDEQSGRRECHVTAPLEGTEAPAA